MLLMQGWPSVDYHDWPAGTKGLPFHSGDWFTKSVLCQTYKQKTGFPFRTHFSSSVKTRPEFLFYALTETCPRPKSNLEYLCFLWSGQECCNETMHDIPVCSDMGESFLKTRCVCVSVWHVCTMLGSLFRKDWACSVCILEMSSWSCGGSVTMEAEMKMMLEWNLCKIY